jgi:hypothetical protein
MTRAGGVPERTQPVEKVVAEPIGGPKPSPNTTRTGPKRLRNGVFDLLDYCGTLTEACSHFNTPERFSYEKVRAEESPTLWGLLTLSSLEKEVISMEEGALAGIFAFHFATITSIIVLLLAGRGKR